MSDNFVATLRYLLKQFPQKITDLNLTNAVHSPDDTDVLLRKVEDVTSLRSLNLSGTPLSNMACKYLQDLLINKDHLKDVLVGKKQFFKKQAVTQIQVPHYDELSVKQLYP